MTAVSAESLERRRAAIAVSGWGARFEFFQPHNACFWVYLGLVASGLWYVVTAVQATRGAFNEAYATALVSSGLFTLAFLWFLRWSDRWERTPAALAAAAFVGGGVAAPFAIAITGNSAIMSIYTKVFGQAWATDWQAGLTAPFVEETSKGAIFLLMMGLAPCDPDRFGRADRRRLCRARLPDPRGHLLRAELGVRAVRRAPVRGRARDVRAARRHRHPLARALHRAVRGRADLRRSARPLSRAGSVGDALMLAAMLLHGVWDSAAAIGGPVFGSPCCS